ncbi:TPA: hypothetical protein IAA87_00025 [Candidatus Avigastranaerophilus faecigallinarum]|nr:hypothetical protein [Candidatus Avigastranaerophilus faecigallinarum]
MLRCVPINGITTLAISAARLRLDPLKIVNSMLSTCSFAAGRGINSSLLTTEFLVLKIGATISFFPSTEKTPVLRLLLV